MAMPLTYLYHGAISTSLLLTLGMANVNAAEGPAPVPDTASTSLAALGYIPSPRPTIRDSLGIVPPSPLVNQAAPTLVVGDWLYGEPIAAFAPEESYALCVMSLLEFHDLLDRFNEERFPAKGTIPWIVVLTTEMPFKLPAGTSPERVAKMKDFILPRIADRQEILKRLQMHVAWDSPGGTMRTAFPGTDSLQRATAIIHRGRILWAGQGTNERPLLSFVSQHADQARGNLSWLLQAAETTQQRALPVVELATSIKARGYLEPGEWDRLTVLACQLERADLGVGFINHTGVDMVDRVLAAGTLENGMFTAQVYLWHFIKRLAEQALRPGSALTPAQQDGVLEELRRQATPEEYQRIVSRSRAAEHVREILRLAKAKAPPGDLAGPLAALAEVGDPAILFIDAHSLMERAGLREAAQRLIVAGQAKMGNDTSSYLIGLCVEAQVAVGDQDGARATVQAAIARAPDRKHDLERILSTIK